MASKTKQAALKAARKALGDTATEGVDFQLRNTGAGWEHEPIPPANEPAKKARVAKAPKAVSKRATITQPQADAAVRAHKAKAAAPAPRKARVSAKPKGEQPAPAPGIPKTELIVSMLKRKDGATSKQLEDATGWKPHSVRGLLGTLRQRGVKVLSSKEKGRPTVYRIAAEARAAAPAPEVGDVI